MPAWRLHKKGSFSENVQGGRGGGQDQQGQYLESSSQTQTGKYEECPVNENSLKTKSESDTVW